MGKDFKEIVRNEYSTIVQTPPILYVYKTNKNQKVKNPLSIEMWNYHQHLFYDLH